MEGKIIDQKNVLLAQSNEKAKKKEGKKRACEVV